MKILAEVLKYRAISDFSEKDPAPSSKYETIDSHSGVKGPGKFSQDVFPWNRLGPSSLDLFIVGFKVFINSKKLGGRR
jgi:hypothetical protein